MTEHENSLFEGQVIDESTEITIVQLCRRCAVEAELVERLVAEGIIEPSRQEGAMLYFPQSCTKRTRIVLRLRSDLGVNMAGAALALQLLDRIEKLEPKYVPLISKIRHLCKTFNFQGYNFTGLKPFRVLLKGPGVFGKGEALVQISHEPGKPHPVNGAHQIPNIRGI